MSSITHINVIKMLLFAEKTSDLTCWGCQKSICGTFTLSSKERRKSPKWGTTDG